MSAAAPLAQPSFRTEQVDFFFPVRSCEPVGLRREKSLFYVHSVSSVLSVLNPFLRVVFTHLT